MIQITNDYGTHQYNNWYEKSEYYCPSCGNKTVYEQLGAEDYYIGAEFNCITCKSIFYIPSLYNASGDERVNNIIEQLRIHVEKNK